MRDVPSIINAHGFTTVYGTDSDRRCSFLELRRERANTWDVLVEVASPEDPGELTISVEEEVPAPVLEGFITYARSYLAEPGWGSRLTSG